MSFKSADNVKFIKIYLVSDKKLEVICTETPGSDVVTTNGNV